MSSPNVSTKGAPPLPARRDFTYAPPSDALKILYKDDDIIVVDKPAGLLSVPGRELPDCLQSRLLALYPDSLLVHRLDMATSGVMVFARNKTAQRHLGLQFERRHTSKTYIARVDGNIAGETGRINLPLIADWPPSITDWEVIAREEAATRLALHPVTGRSHQLRVHCWAMGHLYAVDKVFTATPRLQLHAWKLGLRHPQDGEPITFESVCPF